MVYNKTIASWSQETLVPGRPSLSPTSSTLESSTDSSFGDLSRLSMAWVDSWASDLENLHASHRGPFFFREAMWQENEFPRRLGAAISQGIRLEHALAMPVTRCGKNIVEIIIGNESYATMSHVQKIAGWRDIEFADFKLGPNYLAIRRGAGWYGLSNAGASYFSGEMTDGVAHGWCKHHITWSAAYEGEFFQGLHHGFGKMYISLDTGRTIYESREGVWQNGRPHEVDTFRFFYPSILTSLVGRVLNFFDLGKEVSEYTKIKKG